MFRGSYFAGSAHTRPPLYGVTKYTSKMSECTHCWATKNEQNKTSKCENLFNGAVVTNSSVIAVISDISENGASAPVPSGLLIQYGCTRNTNILKLTQIQKYIIRTTAHTENPILKCGVLENEDHDEKRRKPTIVKLEGYRKTADRISERGGIMRHIGSLKPE